jgi:hypothetical protein
MPLPRMSDKYKIFKYPFFAASARWAGHVAGHEGAQVLGGRGAGRIQKEEKKKNKAAKEIPGWVHGRQPGFLARHVHFHVQVRAACTRHLAEGQGCIRRWPAASRST